MSEVDTAEVAERRRQGQRGPDKGPRRPPKFRPQDAIKAASLAGYAKVRLTLDSDGKMTLEMGQAGDSPADDKGETNECDTILDRMEKAAKSTSD